MMTSSHQSNLCPVMPSNEKEKMMMMMMMMMMIMIMMMMTMMFACLGRTPRLSERIYHTIPATCEKGGTNTQDGYVVHA